MALSGEPKMVVGWWCLADLPDFAVELRPCWLGIFIERLYGWKFAAAIRGTLAWVLP